MEVESDGQHSLAADINRKIDIRFRMPIFILFEIMSQLTRLFS